MFNQVVEMALPLESSREAISDNQAETPNILIQQNRLLNNKIQLIEIQNIQQQKRLQQLEELILELGSAKKSGVVGIQNPQHGSNQDNLLTNRVDLDGANPLYHCGSVTTRDLNGINGHVFQNHRHRSRDAEISEAKDIPFECRKFFEGVDIPPKYYSNKVFDASQCNLKVCQSPIHGHRELGMSDDVQSIMEEFDRNARENGLKYGVTPESSVVGSEDLGECKDTPGCDNSRYTLVADDPLCDLDVVTSPSSELLTPSYQHTRTTHSQYCSEDGPMITPQSCLTTPVLLTSEALRAAERVQEQSCHNRERKYPRALHGSNPSEVAIRKCAPHSSFKRKANPFANLLSNLRQTSKVPLLNHSGLQDDTSRNDNYSDNCHQLQCNSLSNAASQRPFYSPSHSIKSVNSSYIREWSQSTKLPFLSPLSENQVECRHSTPGCSPNSTTSSRIKSWYHSMKMSYLSPMSESYCGDEGLRYLPRSPSSCSNWKPIQEEECLLPVSVENPSTFKLCDSDVDFLGDLMIYETGSAGDVEASEEEDLVVDEVVSLSMDNGNNACNGSRISSSRNSVSNNSTGNCSTSTSNTRQRTESVCSITGPCVPPDLLLNTSLNSLTDSSLVLDTDIEEEIAGMLDGDLTFEESVIIPDDGVLSAPQIKVGEEDKNAIVVDDPGAGLELEDGVVLDNQAESCFVSYAKNSCEGNAVESLDQTDVVDPEIEAGGGFRNVAELIGNNSQSLVCKKINSRKEPKETTVNVDGKNIKLQAGSIVLAVVNESGSLVPLPQLPLKSSKLARAIKVEASPEKNSEEEIDVETVGVEKTPVLEAGDVDSLLAQFEASEAVNTSNVELPSVRNQPTNNKPSISSISKSSQKFSVNNSGSQKPSSHGSPTHQKIKDALPKEIIEKIKASTKRKSTQMLSEPLLVRKGRGVKQQEQNSRGKSQRTAVSTTTPATTGKSSPNDRVPPPIDHDYCFSPDKQKKNKASINDSSSQSADCFNKLPDYYTVGVSKKENKNAIGSNDYNHDDSGKKDSGVESGDVSDASVETEDRKKDGRTNKCAQSAQDNWDNGKGQVFASNGNIEDIYNKLPPYMTDIGNVKPKVEEEEEEEPDTVKVKCEEEEQQNQEVKKIKRKLNLSEYRQRIKSTHSSRCPSPNQADPTSTAPIGDAPLSLGDLIKKMKEAETEKESTESTGTVVPEDNSVDAAVPAEDEEEGELRGESDQELTKPSEQKSVDTVERKLPLSSPTSVGGSMVSSGRESRKGGSGSSQGYGSRRWSSSSHSRSRSRSHSRSRSRSPRRRRHSSSRYRRSSRGKRRGARRRSSRSISSGRCWSKSRSRSRSYSRSRGRSSSHCSSSSCSCSDSSQSRSRSRSRRDRSYSRRYSRHWERRRRSRSWSRGSSRYSRSRRSRSRSRSPPPRRPIRPRREGEDRQRQVEERRVIYVGRISEGTTKAELRRRFQKYGSIVDISVHFRDHGDNYGFVTYKNKDEAYNAVENGNEDPSYPRYDLCFGGRRAFCRVKYSDLDAQDDDPSYLGSAAPGSALSSSTSNDFDSLLRAAMKRKTR